MRVRLLWISSAAGEQGRHAQLPGSPSCHRHSLCPADCPNALHASSALQVLRQPAVGCRTPHLEHIVLSTCIFCSLSPMPCVLASFSCACVSTCSCALCVTPPTRSLCSGPSGGISYMEFHTNQMRKHPITCGGGDPVQPGAAASTHAAAKCESLAQAQYLPDPAARLVSVASLT